MLLVALPVLAVTVVAVLVLQRVLDISTSTGRLEMIRTALAVGAGTGAVLTLTLAWRRQWATEYDTAERRLTELYIKAVEQLGSDKAAVRHGALYALERVAQDNPDHRQTVVDVICAYLRAPYTPPREPVSGRRESGMGAARTGRYTRRVAAIAARRAVVGPPRLAAADQDRREERGVRLAAQRVLTRHLNPSPDRPRRPIFRAERSRRRAHIPWLRWSGRPAGTFWPDMDIDLEGAHLIDLDMYNCHIRRASFCEATLTGYTRFDNVVFTSHAEFGRAVFIGDVEFGGATFTGATMFGGVTFAGRAGFFEATFTDNVWFFDATFTGEAIFHGATFARDVEFSGATFAGGAAAPGQVRG